MAINIHFFTKDKEFDYSKLLEYFDAQEDFDVYYTDDYVEAICSDDKFNFQYRYLITRHSRVTKIYDLNPEYVNINFLLEMPTLIPSFLAKEILINAQALCKTFGFGVYHDSFSDVINFNVVDMLDLFDNMRRQYIENYGLQGKILLEGDKLDVLFKYERSVDTIKNGLGEDVAVNNCFPVVNHVNNTTGISYRFKLGEATVIPPYIDYLYIDTEDGTFLVSKKAFEKCFGRRIDSIDGYLPDLHIIKPRNAKALKGEAKKIQRISIDGSSFIPLNLCDVIEA